MSFPNPPVPDQEYTHSNGITYIFSDTKKAWEIKYEQATNTASLPLANPTGTYLLTGDATLPDTGGLLTQSHYNEWAFNSLVKVDATSRVDSGETAPGDADTNQLWYKPSTGSLYVYYNDGSSTQWVEIGGGGGDISGLEDRLEILENALLPWVEFDNDTRWMRYKPGSSHIAASIDITQYWSSSSAGEYTWAWMIKMPGTDVFVDVDDLSQSDQDSIGYNGTEAWSFLYLYPPDPSDMPDIEIHLKITDDIDGMPGAEGISDPFFPRQVWVSQGSFGAFSSTTVSKSGKGTPIYTQQ